ncbi:hypothetical protein BD414DRAFT_66381 [Trametes punicea]|nr:hypothetical protein BD414DRAFT_66381 [Trametes punicea]
MSSHRLTSHPSTSLSADFLFPRTGVESGAASNSPAHISPATVSGAATLMPARPAPRDLCQSKRTGATPRPHPVLKAAVHHAMGFVEDILLGRRTRCFWRSGDKRLARLRDDRAGIYQAKGMS